MRLRAPFETSLHFHRPVPGETTALGFAGDRPVLLLPGRFDAALAGWLTIGRRMLARLAFRLSVGWGLPRTRADVVETVRLGLAAFGPGRLRPPRAGGPV